MLMTGGISNHTVAAVLGGSGSDLSDDASGGVLESATWAGLRPGKRPDGDQFTFLNPLERKGAIFDQ
jgi:hypothetical protein